MCKKEKECRALLLAAALVLSLLIVASPAVFAQTAEDALSLYRQGRHSEAIGICLAEIEAGAGNVESYVVLCWALIASSRYEEAENWATRGRGISRYETRLIEAQGEACFYQGKNERALAAFQEYIAYASGGSMLGEVYDFMGEIFLRMGKYRHADIAFSAALNFSTDSTERWARIGYAREMAGELRYALDAYNRALELNSNNQDAVRGRANVMRRMN